MFACQFLMHMNSKIRVIYTFKFILFYILASLICLCNNRIVNRSANIFLVFTFLLYGMTNFLSADTLLFYFLSIFYTQIFFVECVTHKHTQFYRSIQEVIIIVGVAVVFLLVDIRKKNKNWKGRKVILTNVQKMGVLHLFINCNYTKWKV